jgi:hypothetical protein
MAGCRGGIHTTAKHRLNSIKHQSPYRLAAPWTPGRRRRSRGLGACACPPAGPRSLPQGPSVGASGQCWVVLEGAGCSKRSGVWASCSPGTPCRPASRSRRLSWRSSTKLPPHPLPPAHLRTASSSSIRIFAPRLSSSPGAILFPGGVGFQSPGFLLLVTGLRCLLGS